MDRYEILHEHGLLESASNEEIEQTALPLLGKGDTILPAAELVLGRTVESEEFQTDETLRTLMYPFLTPGDRLAALILKRDLDPKEVAKRESGGSVTG